MCVEKSLKDTFWVFFTEPARRMGWFRERLDRYERWNESVKKGRRHGLDGYMNETTALKDSRKQRADEQMIECTTDAKLMNPFEPLGPRIICGIFVDRFSATKKNIVGPISLYTRVQGDHRPPIWQKKTKKKHLRLINELSRAG